MKREKLSLRFHNIEGTESEGIEVAFDKNTLLTYLICTEADIDSHEGEEEFTKSCMMLTPDEARKLCQILNKNLNFVDKELQ